MQLAVQKLWAWRTAGAGASDRDRPWLADKCVYFVVSLLQINWSRKWWTINCKRKITISCSSCLKQPHIATNTHFYNYCSPFTIQLQPSYLWTQHLIHYSGNTGLNRFPALTPHLSPASSSSQINIPHRVQRARDRTSKYSGVFGGIAPIWAGLGFHINTPWSLNLS